MKTQVWVYAVVVALSALAGVAIAGVPTFEAAAPTLVVPETTTTPTTVPPTTVPVSAPADDETDDEADDETDDGDTTTSTTTTTEPPILERGELSIAVANGASVGGAASQARDALEEIEYDSVGSFDGSDIVDFTIVYFADGVDAEVERLVEDIVFAPDLVAPIDEAPEVSGLDDDVDVLVYLGRDVRDLPFFN